MHSAMKTSVHFCRLLQKNTNATAEKMTNDDPSE